MSSNLPYSVSGTITDSEGANPSGLRVTIRNDRTIETINITTSASGQYIGNLGNLTSGYENGDSITVIASQGIETGSETFTVSGAATEQNVTMAEVEASAEVDYCTISEIRTELDDKTSTDITSQDIKNNIKRSEAYIDLRTKTSYKSNTITQEVYATNADTMYISREGSLLGVTGGLQRADSAFMGGDTMLIKRNPINKHHYTRE